ncbi:morphogenetic protein [Klebsiella pneumoniae]|nr:morphogenetic protein [Klebsiella pneumoniae]
MLHVEDEMQNGKGGWGGLVGDACPFGAVGDRIWVRETWGVVSHAFSDDGLMIDWVPDRPATAIHEMPFGNGYYSGYAIYAADGDFTWGDDDGYEDGRSCWKPSIHMPRAASRILLEITDVRVERLRSMSQDDARAEGVIAASGPMEAGLAFRELWDSIYGEESWKANPWVWVIKFKRMRS